MVSKIALVGLVILVIGAILGAYGAVTPAKGTTTQSTYLLSPSLVNVEPNGYSSRDVPLNAGQQVSYAFNLENSTIFDFYVMTQPQYYSWYSCAPFCFGPIVNNASQGGMGGSGPWWQQAGLSSGSQGVAYEVNDSTATPRSGNITGTFTAPSNTQSGSLFYFVFDNSIGGPSYSNYLFNDTTGGQNGVSHAVGYFSLATNASVATSSVNWVFVISGVVVLIIGGAIGTIFWDTRRAAPKATPTATK